MGSGLGLKVRVVAFARSHIAGQRLVNQTFPNPCRRGQELRCRPGAPWALNAACVSGSAHRRESECHESQAGGRLRRSAFTGPAVPSGLRRPCVFPSGPAPAAALCLGSWSDPPADADADARPPAAASGWSETGPPFSWPPCGMWAPCLVTLLSSTAPLGVQSDLIPCDWFAALGTHSYASLGGCDATCQLPGHFCGRREEPGQWGSACPLGSRVWPEEEGRESGGCGTGEPLPAADSGVTPSNTRPLRACHLRAACRAGREHGEAVGVLAACEGTGPCTSHSCVPLSLLGTT